jgi:hypothetical protein
MKAEWVVEAERELRHQEAEAEPEVYCEAKTYAQARSGTWAGSQATNGCQRKAVTQVNGHWACRQHAARPPANGWNL